MFKITGLRKCTLFTVVPVVLAAMVLWVPASASDTALQSVTLSCSDGTLSTLEVDTTTLSALVDGVTAINGAPTLDAAVTCSLSQPHPTVKQLMAGGGEVAGVDFGIAAHGDATGENIRGRYRFGDLAGPVTCLVAVGNVGVLGGPIDGGFFTAFVTAMDGGGGNPDTMNLISTSFSADQAGCAAVLALFPPTFGVSRGNVVVRGIE
jgi:hypothetical protein